jgi:hypothetical protein
LLCSLVPDTWLTCQVIPTNKPGLVVVCMEAEVAFVAMAADARGDPGLRDTIATVPAEYGTSKGWRFNDCRATPGGAIFAGRSASVPFWKGKAALACRFFVTWCWLQQRQLAVAGSKRKSDAAAMRGQADPSSCSRRQGL